MLQIILLPYILKTSVVFQELDTMNISQNLVPAITCELHRGGKTVTAVTEEHH